MWKSILGSIIAFPTMVWFYIWIGSRDILRIGRKKVEYRDLMKSLKWRDKVFPIKYVDLSIAAKNLQSFFVAMYFVFYGIIVALVVVVIASRFVSSQYQMIRYYLIFVGLLIEWPALIIVICNLSFERHKRSAIWKFSNGYEKIRKK